MLACHLKGIKDGVHYEYRETMPYKREPEFLEVSPKDGGIIRCIKLQTVAYCRNDSIFDRDIFSRNYAWVVLCDP